MCRGFQRHRGQKIPTLIELLRHNNIPLKQHGEHHHAGPGWVQIDCPNCSPDWGKFRLGFHPNSGRSFCWVCGPVDGVAILSGICGVSLRDSAAILRTNYTGAGTAERTQGRLQLPQAGDLLPAHRNYLKGRGFDPDEIAGIWGVRGIGPLHPTLAWRLLLPIADRAGRVVSWTTRAIKKDAKLRYISASPEQESVSHKTLLYGAHLARGSIVVCEGPLDAWKIGPGAVATFGVSYSQAQLLEMVRYSVRVVCFDAEKDAQLRADRLCRELSIFPGVTENICLDSGKDAGEAEHGEIREIRQRYLR